MVFAGNLLAKDKINLRFFYSPSCKACIKVKQEHLPTIIYKYKDKINIEYFDISNPDILKIFVALEKRLKKDLKVPLILIGKNSLSGSKQIIK